MIDEEQTVYSEDEAELPPPRFDEHASARAQPVQPIRRRGLTFGSSFGKLRQMISAQSRALVLIIIAGLITGTVAGMMWANKARSESALASESVSGLTAATAQTGELETIDADSRSATTESTLQSAGPNWKRTRNRGQRVKARGAQRAYRVAVIH